MNQRAGNGFRNFLFIVYASLDRANLAALLVDYGLAGFDGPLDCDCANVSITCSFVNCSVRL